MKAKATGFEALETPYFDAIVPRVAYNIIKGHFSNANQITLLFHDQAVTA